MENLCSNQNWIEAKGNREVIFAKLVRITMFMIFAIYPFGMVVPEVWNKIDGVLWLDEQLLVVLLCAMPLITLIILWRAIPEKLPAEKTAMVCCIIFCISVTARLFCSALLQTEPISDFKTCYDYAATGVMAKREYLTTYPYLGAYALTLKRFFSITGASVFNAQLLNTLVTSAIPGLIFLAVKRVTKRANVAIVAGMAYALFPSMVIYTAIPSCEQFAQFYLSVFVCFVAYYCTEKAESKLRWLYASAAGIAFGGLCVYKDLFIVVAPAFLMVSFCYEVLPVLCDAIQSKQFAYKELLRIAILDLIVIILALGVSRSVINAVQTEIIGYPYETQFSLSSIVYEGLCAEGGGTWNENVKNFVYETQQSCQTSKEVDQILYGALYEDYKDNPRMLLDLIGRKFTTNWCEEGVYYYWTHSGERNILQGTWIGEVLFVIIPSAWFMLVSAVICIGSILSLIQKERIVERYFNFFVTGIIFLFALMLILMEAQGRYKSNLSPLVCIVFALCMNRILNVVERLIDFTKAKVVAAWKRKMK